MALGTSLSDNVALLSLHGFDETNPRHKACFNDLHEALCALANILEPLQEVDSYAFRSEGSSVFRESNVSIKCCLDTAKSGGLDSLLTIATVPFDSTSTKSSSHVPLLEEACRSLASIAPLLLTSEVASAGYGTWAYDVLRALHSVLKRFGVLGSQFVDLQVVVLQGLGALAGSAPLKVWIIDETLPFLLQVKTSDNEGEVSIAANHVFQCLNLANNEEAAQVAGNAPDIFAEWFCLRRSLLIQAMARAEIRQLVHNTWHATLQEIEHGPIELFRQSSGMSRISEESRENADQEVFSLFADDEDNLQERHLLIKQYHVIYGERFANGAVLDGQREKGNGLLAQQTYPLNSSEAEARWILDHRRYLSSLETNGCLRMSDHVTELLSVCFPSPSLRDNVVPLLHFNPESSFNFRALMMARKRYFSFRREGQLLLSLCDKEVASPGSMDAHWSLGFTNSSFAGEFSESLVQVLYKCPMIRGLSFVRNSDWKSHDENEEKDNSEDETVNQSLGGAWLASLTGSLPPWISHLTFEGVIDDEDLLSLSIILETMSKLSESQGGNDVTDERPEISRSQGTFCFLAIRKSPNLSAESWVQFLKLLGMTTSILKGPSRSSLASLSVLDLCGNLLGDELCASVLEVALDEFSGCHLEHLDLADNDIQEGERILRVLRSYYNKRVSTIRSRGRRWQSSLHTLSLALNSLHKDNVWLEIVTLVQNDVMGFSSVDLSSNDLKLSPHEVEYADIFLKSISCSNGLDRLDLSNNFFSSALIDRIFSALSANEAALTMISLERNSPPLEEAQSLELQLLTKAARRKCLKSHLYERDHVKGAHVSREVAIHDPLEGTTKRKSGPSSELTIPESQVIGKSPTLSSSLFQTTSGLGANSITVLFSAPLVFTDGRTLRPFAKLDFDMERELMWQCLKEASRDIELSFDSATHDRLLATMAKRCSCLHYSGHGHQHYLPFEDGSGGPYWFKVDKFKSLIETEGGAPFRFVFVSACYSYLAGETFASAGVPHVVCCQQESELKDTAALAFTRQFYLALAIGHTVKDSFDQGCKAVRATPNLKDPEAEMNKFLLLPKDGNHDVPIFNAKPVPEWPKRSRELQHTKSHRNSARSISVRSISARSVLGGARSSELSVRNMMQEDPSPSPPEFFLGREVETYYVLKAVLSKRLVSVIGEPGVGRSSLVCALCHYINERATTMIGIDRIYFVRARQSRKRNPFRSLVQRFLKKLEEEEKTRPIHPDADMESMFDAICKFLKHEKALLVFDRAEVAIQADDSNEFPMLLSKLCRETKHVKVLLTNRRDLGIPSLGEHPVSLGPLNFANTVRLFANLCPYLHTPTDRKKLFDTLVKDQEGAEVLATDPGVIDSTKKVFAILGDGVPARIEKAAYDLSKEDFLSLYKSMEE